MPIFCCCMYSFFNILHSDAPVFTKKTVGMSSLFVLAIFQESLHVLHANLIIPFIDMHNNRQMLFLHKPNSQVSVYLCLMTHFSSMEKVVATTGKGHMKILSWICYLLMIIISCFMA